MTTEKWENIPLWVIFSTNWEENQNIYIRIKILCENNKLQVMDILDKFREDEELRKRFAEINSIDIEKIEELLESETYPQNRKSNNKNYNISQEIYEFRKVQSKFSLPQNYYNKTKKLCLAYGISIEQLYDLEINWEKFKELLRSTAQMKDYNIFNNLKSKHNDFHRLLILIIIKEEQKNKEINS